MTKCAAVQMASSPDVRANLIEVERLICDADKSDARLVVLPENFALMGETEFDKLDHKESDDGGPIQEFLSRLSKQHSIWLVAGTIPMVANSKNKIRAACLVFNDKGERVARYDKIHLFDVNVPGTEEQYQESETIEAGENALVLDTPFGKIGVAVCYDLRFPELFRQMIDEGMEILMLPSAFTAKTGAAHWDLLVRTRAVENLCYVIASNQGGFHLNGRETYGHSMIVDPWGKVVSEITSGSGIACGEVDCELLRKIRVSFPALNHRRLVCGLN